MKNKNKIKNYDGGIRSLTSSTLVLIYSKLQSISCDQEFIWQEQFLLQHAFFSSFGGIVFATFRQFMGRNSLIYGPSKIVSGCAVFLFISLFLL